VTGRAASSASLTWMPQLCGGPRSRGECWECGLCRAERGLSGAWPGLGGGRSSGPSMRSGSPLAGWAFLPSLLTARSVCRQPIMGPRSDDAAGDGRRGFAVRDARGPAPSLLGSPGAVGSGGSDLGGVAGHGRLGVRRWGVVPSERARRQLGARSRWFGFGDLHEPPWIWWRLRAHKGD
jgi:hypothetical protein